MNLRNSMTTMTTTIDEKAKKILDRFKRFVIHFNNDLEAYYKADESGQVSLDFDEL